ncbi:MAG: TRAP transporter small permease [Clostridiales Family XIII bacterium]|jgi:TRAP-type C4-dicarboxylate transport system permease small subunit|nr:TRAP transporter small permease [Clostridiales Family XIII bacterium]
MNRKKLSFSDIYNHFEEILIVLLFVVMVVVIFIQVIMRYAFQHSLPWSEEMGRFIFEWLTWLGISLGARYGEHIKITMLVDRLPFRTAQAINILADIIVIGICAVTIGTGIILGKTFVSTLFTMMRFSIAWGYAAPVVGCTLMIMRAIVSIVQSSKKLISGPPPEEALTEAQLEGGDF